MLIWYLIGGYCIACYSSFFPLLFLMYILDYKSNALYYLRKDKIMNLVGFLLSFVSSPILLILVITSLLKAYSNILFEERIKIEGYIKGVRNE